MPVKHTKELWEKPPHTEMKHEILRRYLQAWLPILSSFNQRIAIIDGFAGPGEYIDPENPDNRLPGSPLIIMETILNHILRNSFGEILILFIEDNGVFAHHLEHLLTKRYPLSSLGNIRYQVIKGEFATTVKEILDDLSSHNATMAPCFAFIDPFGPRGIPMDLIAQFMNHPFSEVLINYPYDPINRRLKEPKYENCLDQFFGCPNWRHIRHETLPSVRKEELLELYLKQLNSIGGVGYTLPFEMLDQKNRTAYFLVFGTKHLKGLDEMKKVMWKISPTGDFQFSDYVYNKNKLNEGQLILFPPQPDYNDLAKSIWDHFKGKKVGVENIINWVILHTRYCSIHVRKALGIIEEIWKIRKWDAGKPYLRKKQFPERIIVEFLGDQEEAPY